MGARNVIAVTGSGRSGTSVCMYLLEALGAYMSPVMTPASPQNPDGGREDVEVFEIHQETLLALHSNTYLPLPVGWQKHEAADRAVSKLKTVVASRMALDETRLWAVKDPNLSLFIPLWTRVFNVQKVIPAYILCIRHPEVVVRSMESQYGRSAETAMMMWILRNAYTLISTGGNCIVAHYEDWESGEAAAQLHRMARNCGLAEGISEARCAEILASTYKTNLNRTGYVKEHSITHPYARRLYEALRATRGGELAQREAVIAAEEALDAMEHFRGLAMVAQESLQKLAGARVRGPGQGVGSPQPAQLKAEVERLKLELKQASKGDEQLKAEVERLKRELKQAGKDGEHLAAHIRFLEGLLNRVRGLSPDEAVHELTRVAGRHS